MWGVRGNCHHSKQALFDPSSVGPAFEPQPKTVAPPRKKGEPSVVALSIRIYAAPLTRRILSSKKRTERKGTRRRLSDRDQSKTHGSNLLLLPRTFHPILALLWGSGEEEEEEATAERKMKREPKGASVHRKHVTHSCSFSRREGNALGCVQKKYQTK